MVDQGPLPRPVCRSVRHTSRTPPLLDISGEQIGVPRRYPQVKGCPYHTGGVTLCIPPGLMHMSYCSYSP